MRNGMKVSRQELLAALKQVFHGAWTNGQYGEWLNTAYHGHEIGWDSRVHDLVVLP